MLTITRCSYPRKTPPPVPISTYRLSRPLLQPTSPPVFKVEARYQIHTSSIDLFFHPLSHRKFGLLRPRSACTERTRHTQGRKGGSGEVPDARGIEIFDEVGLDITILLKGRIGKVGLCMMV